MSRYLRCPWPGCGATALTLVSEDYDVLDRVWVGRQVCDVCGGSTLYKRRPEREEAAAITAAMKRARELPLFLEEGK